jgi:hypothetical protein
VKKAMINELSLLKLHPETASTKQKIISLLSDEWPLSAKRVHNNLKRAYGTELSYQGVHETLKEMEEQKVIEKKKNEYLLNIEWIQQSKKVLERVEKKYLQNQKIVIPENFSGSIEIEFDSISDLCVSVAELLASKQLSGGRSCHDIYGVLEYGWWPFKFRFEHFELLLRIVRANNPMRGGIIIRKKTPFGKWIREQYVKIKAICAPLGTKFDIGEDIFIVENCLLEIKVPQETKKIIEHYYNKWKNLNDTFKEFGLKEEPKAHSVIRISKNPELANYLRKQLNKVFGEAKE